MINFLLGVGGRFEYHVRLSNLVLSFRSDVIFFFSNHLEIIFVTIIISPFLS